MAERTLTQRITRDDPPHGWAAEGLVRRQAARGAPLSYRNLKALLESH